MTGLRRTARLAALVGLASTAAAEDAAQLGDPWDLCDPAIAAAEAEVRLPRHLMRAIALAESGRLNEERDTWIPWPWTINSAGDSYFLDAKAEAVAAVMGLRSEGRSNIDVGCMQVNLAYHPDAFESLEQAFDPESNAAYAARLLRSLYRRTGSWIHAVQLYHSSKFRNNYAYRNRVMRLWRQLRGGR